MIPGPVTQNCLQSQRGVIIDMSLVPGDARSLYGLPDEPGQD